MSDNRNVGKLFYFCVQMLRIEQEGNILYIQRVSDMNKLLNTQNKM